MTVNERNLLAKVAARSAHPVFVANGWTYGTGDAAQTPSVKHLESTVRRLIGTVLNETIDGGPVGSSSSGRFTVWRDCEGTDVVIGVTLDLATIYESDSCPSGDA